MLDKNPERIAELKKLYSEKVKFLRDPENEELAKNQKVWDCIYQNPFLPLENLVVLKQVLSDESHVQLLFLLEHIDQAPQSRNHRVYSE